MRNRFKFVVSPAFGMGIVSRPLGLLILALGLVGCAQPKATAPMPAPSAPFGRPHSTLTVADFAFINRSTSAPAIAARLGPPDTRGVISPGHEHVVYPLADGTVVAIEELRGEDGWRILSVRHGNTVLFEQAR